MASPTARLGSGSSSTGPSGAETTTRPTMPSRSTSRSRERADPIPAQAHLLALEVGEGTASGAVEVELTVEDDEGGGDRDPLAAKLARGEGEKAVRSVPAAHVETDEAGGRVVEEHVHGDAEAFVPERDGPTDELTGPVKRPHSAGEHARAPRRRNAVAGKGLQ